MAKEKRKHVIDNITNSRVYKYTLIKGYVGCIYCAPNKGCNRINKWSYYNAGCDNWKKHRKTQYRVK